jgi:hypothetical protein
LREVGGVEDAPLSRLSVLIQSAEAADAEAFRHRLLRSAQRPLAELVGGAGGAFRIGVRLPRDPLAAIAEETTGETLGTVDGAVELTVGEANERTLGRYATEVGRMLHGAIDPSRTVLTVGRVHRITGGRRGSVLLGLAFARHPKKSVSAFRSWWLDQHAKVAVRLLLPELVSYEQVHVDRSLSRRVSEGAGFTYRGFDGYDSLTWETLDAFLRSVAKPGGRDEMYADEAGYIDHTTYLGGLMEIVASSDDEAGGT